MRDVIPTLVLALVILALLLVITLVVSAGVLIVASVLARLFPIPLEYALLVTMAVAAGVGALLWLILRTPIPIYEEWEEEEEEEADFEPPVTYRASRRTGQSRRQR